MIVHPYTQFGCKDISGSGTENRLCKQSVKFQTMTLTLTMALGIKFISIISLIFIYTLEYSEGFSEKNTSEEVSTKQLLAHSHYKYVMAHAPLCALAWYIILAQVLSGGLSMGSVSVTTAASLLVKISSLIFTLPLGQLIQYWHKQSMRKTFKTLFVISTQQIQSGQITRKITKRRKAKNKSRTTFFACLLHNDSVLSTKCWEGKSSQTIPCCEVMILVSSTS